MKEDYVFKKMYYSLFNAVTDALMLLRSDPEIAGKKLREAQQACEEMYICDEDEF